MSNISKKIRENMEKLEIERKYKREHNIIIELEKWLEEEINYWEQQEEIWIKEGFMKFGGEANNKIIFKKSLAKLQELKGDME